MRRDPNLIKILVTDPQNTAIDKINSNFIGIHYLSGGNLGVRGLTGPMGALGFPGDPGPTGNNGIRGNRWFVNDVPPSGGIGNVIINGDYWIDSSSLNNQINKFSSSGWTETDYDLAANSQFAKFLLIPNIYGDTEANATYYKKAPDASTFNFSDVVLDKSNANPLHSMFVISSDGSVSDASALLEFSRGDLVDGTPADYLKHPILNFINTAGDNSDIVLLVPQHSLRVDTLGNGLTGTIDYNINFQIDGELDIRAANGVYIESESTALNGFTINSSGPFVASVAGSIKPIYSNFNYYPSSYDRIKISNYIDVTSQSLTIPGLKVSSKIDTNVTGAGGNLSIGLSGGNFTPGTDGYKPDNYALKMSTVSPSLDLIERFSINAAGCIYEPKKSYNYTFITSSSNNVNYDGSKYRSWYNIANVNYEYSGKTVAFGSDKNEIIIDPIGIPENYLFSVGLLLTTVNGVSYLNNLKHIGETLNIRVRSANPDIKIGSVGITYLGSLVAQNNYRYPYTKVHTFTDASSVVDFTIVKQTSGYTVAGDLVFFKGSGESGVWTTST